MLGVGATFPPVQPEGGDRHRPEDGLSDIDAAPRRASGRWCSSGRRTSPSSARPRLRRSAGSTAISPTADAVVGVSIGQRIRPPGLAKHHADLRDLPFPMLADVKRELRARSASSTEARGSRCARPSWSIRTASSASSVTDLTVGRNRQEVLRVLDALQTDELCPCNWKKGEEVLQRALRPPEPASAAAPRAPAAPRVREDRDFDVDRDPEGPPAGLRQGHPAQPRLAAPKPRSTHSSAPARSSPPLSRPATPR